MQTSAKPEGNQCQPLTRNDIKAALERVYKAETKPVNVGAIKTRTGIALTFMIIGTILISISMAIKFLAFELNLIIIGILVILIVFLVGFVVSTKDIRAIYRSMSRFKNPNVPAYRKVFNGSMWHTQALVYATLLCVILLGTQSANIIIFNNPLGLLDDDGVTVGGTYKEGTIWLQDVVLGEFYQDDGTGQYYRYVTVEINNTRNYYSKNLKLELQSYFIGTLYDKLSIVLDGPETDVQLLSIKIHDPDDTSIVTYLKLHNENEDKILDQIYRDCLNDIYISDAVGVISKSGMFSQSIEVTVAIYNQGSVRGPETLTVWLYNPIGGEIGELYRGSIKNNGTVKQNDFWISKFKFDVRDEAVFNVKLIIDEKTKDEAEVYSS